LVGMAMTDRMVKGTSVSNCRSSAETDLRATAEKEAEAVKELEALLAVDLEGLKKTHSRKVLGFRGAKTMHCKGT